MLDEQTRDCTFAPHRAAKKPSPDKGAAVKPEFGRSPEKGVSTSGNGNSADRPATAGFIVNQHRLPESRLQGRLQQTSDDIAGAAGREGHDNGNRFGWPGLSTDTAG